MVENNNLSSSLAKKSRKHWYVGSTHVLNVGCVTPYKMSNYDTRCSGEMHPFEGTPGGQASYCTSNLYH